MTSVFGQPCARPMFQMCSTFVSTVLDLCIDCARHMRRLCSTHVLNVLDLCCDCARTSFRLCLTYPSTLLTEIGCFESRAAALLRLKFHGREAIPRSRSTIPDFGRESQSIGRAWSKHKSSTVET